MQGRNGHRPPTWQCSDILKGDHTCEEKQRQDISPPPEFPAILNSKFLLPVICMHTQTDAHNEQPLIYAHPELFKRPHRRDCLLMKHSVAQERQAPKFKSRAVMQGHLWCPVS